MPPRALRPFGSRPVPDPGAGVDDVAARRRRVAGGGRLAGDRARRRARRSVAGRHRRQPGPGRRRCCSAAWRLTASRRSGSWSPPRSRRPWRSALAAVLALTGAVQIWHLAVVSLVLGIADGFFYPAYSALLPSVLPARAAAGGQRHRGHAAADRDAGGRSGAGQRGDRRRPRPALAMVVVAVAQLLAVVGLLLFKTTPLRRETGRAPAHPVRRRAHRPGRRLPLHGRGRRGCSAPCCSPPLLVLLIMGPIEVLLPFAVRDQTGGGAGRVRPGHRRVRRGRGHRFTRGRLAAAAPALPHRLMVLLLGRRVRSRWPWSG